MLRVLLSTLRQQANIWTFLVLVPIVALVFFCLIEFAFLASVIHGSFPLALLVDILPSLAYEVFLGGGTAQTVHYLTIILLFSAYLTLILHIFVRRRVFSLSGFSMSALGLLGISLGVSCVACGALVGAILFSVVGATASSFILTLEDTIYLFVGELLLTGSILLVTRAIQKL